VPGADQPIGPAERNRLLRAIRLPIAVAVSGGADSMALLHLVAQWARSHERSAAAADGVPPVVAVTVDHGLRAESAAEADWVGRQARLLGVDHVVLRWTGAKPRSGIQEAAREARYALMTEWASRESLPIPRQILLAHHLDDQAETVLMRLGRGSGVDGLSGMRETEVRVGLQLGHPVEERLVEYVRPLLSIPGARLRATLSEAGAKHIEDPSNQDVRHERVRVRQAVGERERLGLSAEALGLTARRLWAARAALDTAQFDLARAAVDLHDGAWASIDPGMLAAAPQEVALRLLQALIPAFGGQRSPPGRGQLEALLDTLAAPGAEGRTLAGAMISRVRVRDAEAGARVSRIAVHREPGRKPLPEIALGPGQGIWWDRRFYVSASAQLNRDARVVPLGSTAFARLKREFSAIAALPLPARAAATLPSVWCGAELIAVPYLSRVEPGLSGSEITGRALISMRFAPRHGRAVFGAGQVDTRPSSG
jgi:tRNA(Ile)-lysidine synthase